MFGPLSHRLESKRYLTEEIRLPQDFLVALITQRVELFKAIHRPLTADETQMVARSFGVLIDTNRELQLHCEELSRMLESLRSNAKGLIDIIERISDKANFREPLEGSDE